MRATELAMSVRKDPRLALLLTGGRWVWGIALRDADGKPVTFSGMAYTERRAWRKAFGALAQAVTQPATGSTPPPQPEGPDHG